MDKITIKDFSIIDRSGNNINVMVKNLSAVSDGYHSMQELYDHRYLLFLVLLAVIPINEKEPWKSKFHNDGTMFEDSFIAGMMLTSSDDIDTPITYHLPMKYWDLCNAPELEKAPPWDGHTSADVLKRLEDWLK